MSGPYGAGDVPNIQSPSLTGRMSEGFIVLTNGVNVASGLQTLEVKAGQGLRLQIVNPSPVRHMRLRLTDTNLNLVTLYRIGGQGGLLNNPVVEGGESGRV